MKLFSHGALQKEEVKDKPKAGHSKEQDKVGQGSEGSRELSHSSDTERKVIKIAFYAQATRPL